MTSSNIQAVSILLCLASVAVAFRTWHILRDRRLILSAIGTALKNRKSLRIGIPVGILYLAIFMILGGKGGRIHILFGRVIWNATLGEILTGIALAALLTVSVTLFVHGLHGKSSEQRGSRSGAGIAGAFLALLACFCP